MEKIIIDKKTARRFLLMKHGLFGDYRFEKKEGAYQYIRQTGCIQYDPVDSVGKNAELTLQSRVRRFRKKDLYDLLYKDRRLFDYFDKEIAIIPTEDWPYFRSYRDLCARNASQFEGLRELEDFTLDYIERHGPVSSSTLPVKGDIYWHSSLHWSGNWKGKSKASRSVLEQLYTTGDLIIHHKEGSRKFYDLSSKYIAEQILQAADPLPDLYEHIRWRVLRRINAVGMLSNRNSDAFLGIRGMTTEIRNSVFADLIENKEIIPLQIGSGKAIFYILAEDLDLLEKAQDPAFRSKRLEFLAPLDPMLWDRRLIDAVFDFKYTWEIYVPQEKRQYGYYVLPVLYEDRLIGRIEPIIRDGQLIVKNIWLEPKIRRSKKLDHALQMRLRKFAVFNQCGYTPAPLFEQ
jgi:uncharacterized protein YcaQ